MRRAASVVFLSFAIFFGASCRTGADPARVLILDYGAFGPQAIAHELLGFEWWQWQPHGDSRPRRYKIRVAVYNGISKKDVETRYPVIPEKEQDYRYVTKDAALEYLQKQIVESPFEDLTADLAKTRKTIFESFK